MNWLLYIDPGSGSLFFQMIIGFLLGAIYLMKIFWRRILVRMKKIFKISE